MFLVWWRPFLFVRVRFVCSGIVSLACLGVRCRQNNPAPPFFFRSPPRTLPNGLRVIVVPTGFPNIVSLQIPVQTGSRNEVEPGKSGFAHFFEHMMFRGTEGATRPRSTRRS